MAGHTDSTSGDGTAPDERVVVPARVLEEARHAREQILEAFRRLSDRGVDWDDRSSDRTGS
jgi:hypothetical protein